MQTVSISNIRMKIFDGQVRTITNVRRVLNLRKNLFLLGALKAQGASSHVQVEVLKPPRAP